MLLNGTGCALLATAVPEADDKVAFVVHLLGSGNSEGSVLRQDEELILCSRCGDWSALVFPVRQQLSQRMRLQNIARQNVCSCT